MGRVVELIEALARIGYGRPRRRRFAFWLMRRCYTLVEWVDHAAVPKVSPFAFTFETMRGMVLNDTGTSTDRRGAMLLIKDDDEYDRAHNDAGQPNPRWEAEWHG